MPDEPPKTERSRGQQIFDFIWQSALGGIVGVIALILLLKYT